jgi:N4-gp56 family major capsid protein
MADTIYGVNDNETVKLWSRKLARESLKKTYVKRFMGSSSSSMIVIKNETNKGPGDRIRHTLRLQLTGGGIIGDGTLEGNEESLTTYTEDLVINQLRHAVRSGGKMTEQRVPFSIRDEAMQGLSDWWADRWDTWFVNHMTGYTPANSQLPIGSYNGHNTITAPTRHVWAGSNTSDAGLETTATFSLYLIDKAVEMAKVTTTGSTPPPIRPIKVDGKDWFVAFLHPYQVTDLRTKTVATTNHPVLWYNIHTALLQGGSRNDEIFRGALGEYNNVILHENTRIPQGVNSSGAAVSNTRRAFLCGAQAGICGFGQGHDQSTYDWVEKLFDYDNQLGVKAGCISGFKKSVFNSADFATIVMSSRAAAHT